MSAHHWGFIFDGPGLDPKKDRMVIDRGGIRTVLVGVPSVSEAANTAVELVEESAQFLELCGGFGPAGAARVIEAVGDRVAVGFVSFGAESLSKIAAVFAPQT